MRKKKQYSYGTDLYDTGMVLDVDDYRLTSKGRKKKRNWKRRGLL